ncbi:MAG TPA: M43 family zinc metalloprotease, partial [Chitinophagaceae bacterium]|nr:M43 family zinc metalloprotease [Chitinophagaceae bacterium]
MKLRPALLALLIVFAISAFSQQPRCGFDVILKKQLRTDRAFKLRHALQGEMVRKYIKANKERLSAKTFRTMAPAYTIPVVVHVVHTGGAIGSIYNPTAAQITGAIDYLNQVYAGSFPGAEGIGDMDIQFVLAKRDPNCNATDGINRVNGSSLTNYSSGGVNLGGSAAVNDINLKNLIRWDPSRYYNIWVVNKIDGADGTSGSFTAGFAYFPGSNPSFDGTVMLATQMKAGAKTLPHEIGHALNLYHPFEDASGTTCAPNNDCTIDGDEVCDTDPITQPSDLATCRTGTNACTGVDYSPNTERNFMNYTSCFTLFTAGQKARVLASMALPSRASLAASSGSLDPASGPTVCAPKINFQVSEDQKTESSTFTYGCRNYTDYNYNVVIGSAPSALTLVTLTTTGSTSTEDVDYNITTNGNFASPSKVLSFPAGSATSQTFTVRIYNDASVEATESISLGFTVNNGGGNAQVGNGRPALNIAIADNDVAPLAGTATGTASIGAVNALLERPFDAREQKQRTQFLYKASELTAAGVPAGTISGLSLNLQKYSTRPYANFTLKIGSTTVPYLVDGSVYVTGTTTVKSLASFTTLNGWNEIVFDAPYSWNGTSNLVVEICYDNATTDGSNLADQILAYGDGGTSSQGNIFWQSGIGCAESFSAVMYYGTGYKPIIRFNYGIPPTLVGASLNASKQEYLGAFADIYFYDQADNKLLARVRNLSSHDYGCTEIKIDRAGSGSIPFISGNASENLLNKTFRVIPTVNNPAGNYEISFYYTAAEKAAWETSTGQNWNSIQLIKVPSQIANYSPSNRSPDGSGAITTTIPSRGTLGTQYVLTAGFSTGFSGFGAGIINTALPTELLVFEGKLVSNSVMLKWVTGLEENAKSFDIEKSAEGVNFYKI